MPEPPRETPWPSLGVVVPVYNEAAGIEGTCRTLLDTVGEYPGWAVLVAVDDGSADPSLAILQSLSRESDRLHVVSHEDNRGYGRALRTGAQQALELGLDYVAFIDSDLTNPPSDLLKIGELASQGNAYIKGSRFVPGGSMSAVPRRRRIMTFGANLIARWLYKTPVRDVTNGFRAGRTDLICSLQLAEPGFAAIMEEFDQIRRLGVPTVEFPTVLSARSAAQRPTAFSYSIPVLWSYLRYPLRAWLRRA